MLFMRACSDCMAAGESVISFGIFPAMTACMNASLPRLMKASFDNVDGSAELEPLVFESLDAGGVPRQPEPLGDVLEAPPSMSFEISSCMPWILPLTDESCVLLLVTAVDDEVEPDDEVA